MKLTMQEESGVHGGEFFGGQEADMADEIVHEVIGEGVTEGGHLLVGGAFSDDVGDLLVVEVLDIAGGEVFGAELSSAVGAFSVDAVALGAQGGVAFGWPGPLGGHWGQAGG